jgi:hypothetical protein
VDLYEDGDGDGVRIKRFFTDETLPEELKVKLGMIYASSTTAPLSFPTSAIVDKHLPNIGQRLIGGDCRIIISDDLLEFLMNANHDT